MARPPLARGRLRGAVHRMPLAFALQRRRLRRAATRGHGESGVIRALRPRAGTLLVALSYDDGPSPANTPNLLELLARHDAHATFFVVGNEVQKHPELARAVVSAGHELGNHSYSHANPLTLDEAGMAEEFERAAASIEQATGGRPRVLRPPYGKRAPELAALNRPLGVSTVLWSIDSGDAAGFSADRVAHEVISNVRSGDVVLMHDGGDPRPTTLAATEVVLEELGRRGYRFLTVSEAIAHASEHGGSSRAHRGDSRVGGT